MRINVTKNGTEVTLLSQEKKLLINARNLISALANHTDDDDAQEACKAIGALCWTYTGDDAFRKSGDEKDIDKVPA